MTIGILPPLAGFFLDWLEGFWGGGNSEIKF